MAYTQYDILVGNYGSGKTEISLNLALDAAAAGLKVALVDLDIVNPYFRSSAKKELLDEAGIRLIASPFAHASIDLPLVAADVASIFKGHFDYAVIDVGGDPVGATALGRYKVEFGQVLDRLNTNYIINANRPQTMNLPDIHYMFDLIESRSRLKMRWLINNTNMSAESSGENLLQGQALVEEVSEALGLPVRWITAKEAVLEEFKTLAARAGKSFKGEPKAIVTRMRPSWLDY